MTALMPTHGSVADAFVNGNVVSQYFTDWTQGGTRDKAEVSAFKSVFKAYVAGMIDATVALTGWYDPNIDTELYNWFVATTNVDNNWFWAPAGAQGAGAAGNIGYSITGFSTKYEVKSDIKSANSITAEIQLDQDGGGLDRGNVLSPWVTQSAGGTSSSVDSGVVSTANGGVLVVQAFSDTASLVVNLQDSADNTTFANVTGYTLSPANATAAAYRFPAAGVTPTGTIRRYTRVTWTGTGTFLAFFSRK